MSHLLKENDIVHCESQEQYDRIIELAKKAGIEVYWETDKERHWDRFHNLVMSGAWICGDMIGVGSQWRQWHTEAEFVAKMFGVGPKEPPIRIKDWTVGFHDDGSINVGCTTVDNKTLNAICERANKTKKP